MKWNLLHLFFFSQIVSLHLRPRNLDLNLLQGEWKIDAGGKKIWVPFPKPGEISQPGGGTPGTPPATPPPPTPTTLPATPSSPPAATPGAPPSSVPGTPPASAPGTPPASTPPGAPPASAPGAVPGATPGTGSGGGGTNGGGGGTTPGGVGSGGDAKGRGGGGVTKNPTIGGNPTNPPASSNGEGVEGGEGNASSSPKLWVILVPSILGFLLISAIVGYAAYRQVQKKKPPLVTGASLSHSNSLVNRAPRTEQNAIPTVIPVLAPKLQRPRVKGMEEEKSTFQEISIDEGEARFSSSPPAQFPPIIPVQPPLTVRNIGFDLEEMTSPTLPSESYYNKRLATEELISNRSNVSIKTFGPNSLNNLSAAAAAAAAAAAGGDGGASGYEVAVESDAAILAAVVGGAAIGGGLVASAKKGQKKSSTTTTAATTTTTTTTTNNISRYKEKEEYNQSDDLEAFGSRLRSEEVTIEYLDQHGHLLSAKKDFSKSYERGGIGELVEYRKSTNNSPKSGKHLVTTSKSSEMVEEVVTIEEEEEEQKRTIHPVISRKNLKSKGREGIGGGGGGGSGEVKEYLIEETITESVVETDDEIVTSEKSFIITEPDGSQVIEQVLEFEEGDEALSELLETISQHTTEESTKVEKRQRSDGTWETVTMHLLTKQANSPELRPIISQGRIKSPPKSSYRI